MKTIKRIVSAMLCIVMLTTLLLTCAACEEENSENNPHNSVDVTNQIFEVKNDTDYINHTWNPYAYSDFYVEVLGEYGEQVKSDYMTMIDAILNGTTEIEVSFQFVKYIYDMLQVLFPPFYRVVSDSEYDEDTGIMTLRYFENKDEVLKEFGDRVEEILEASVCEGDTDIMKALGIYNYMTPRCVYDYASVDDHYADVSSYRGIMTFTGICQTFAGAYTYLIIQAGVTATSVVAFSQDLASHEWCVARFGDEYYFIDPTFDCGMSSVMYFCFTKEFRYEQDGYPPEWQDVGGIKFIRGDEFEGVHDTTYDYLRPINYDVTIKRENGQMIVTGKSSADKKEYTVVVK